MPYHVYILSNRHRSVFYTGMTNDLPRRLKEHRAGRASQFTKRYNITTLLYAEQHDTREKAAKRERQIKGWSRKKKLRLISSG
jgi:putative endonuclease